MLQYHYQKLLLQFKFDAGTSRGVLRTKDTYFIAVSDSSLPKVIGQGECAPLQNLSIDDRPDYEEKLQFYLSQLPLLPSPWDFYQLPGIQDFPSIIMGIETALHDLENGGKMQVFSKKFNENKERIPINGLIWMGSKDFMKAQIAEKIEAGFSCIKMKIGAIDFEQECELLRYIRQQFSPSDIELRVDANGAFSSDKALEKLSRLADFHLHSIEQPIKQGQWEEMAKLCANTPLPIALDEELIGLHNFADKKALLEAITPQYIILKPSLIGGFKSTEEWLNLAESTGINWWMTSALEANIGLNAIAQFASYRQTSMPQGLGTGKLFHNNIDSPLSIEKGHIWSNPALPWGKWIS